MFVTLFFMRLFNEKLFLIALAFLYCIFCFFAFVESDKCTQLTTVSVFATTHIFATTKRKVLSSKPKTLIVLSSKPKTFKVLSSKPKTMIVLGFKQGAELLFIVLAFPLH